MQKITPEEVLKFIIDHEWIIDFKNPEDFRKWIKEFIYLSKKALEERKYLL